MKQKILIVIAGILVVFIGITMYLMFSPKKYTVTFDTTGGSVIEEVEVKKGTLIGNLEVPTKEDFTFLYWTSNGKICSKTDEITSDMNLKAVWSSNAVDPEVKKYTVTFDSNGGSTVKSEEVEEGKKVEQPKTPTKEGYIFVEWTLDGKSFSFDTNITKDITLKAKWEKVEDKEEVKTYTVTFNTDGGSKISSKKVTEGDKVSKPSNPTKNGYTFVSWTLDRKVYDFNSKVTSNITLTAKWEKVAEVKTYTISVSMVDSFSPDRYLTVYENGTAITVSKIMYTDGVEIKTTINGTKISVASADIVGETKLKVQLTSGKVVTATIK